MKHDFIVTGAKSLINHWMIYLMVINFSANILRNRINNITLAKE